MSRLEVFHCEQGTPEWHECRLGIPTASCLAAVMAKGRKKGEPSLTRRTYMLKLIGERLTGEPSDSFSNKHTDRGHIDEPLARVGYEAETGELVEQVGFMRRGEFGYSPDGLINLDGLLEAKSKLPHLHLDCLLRDKVPSEHMQQIQGGLWVSEREWCDFTSYSRGCPQFIKRVYRDEIAIKAIAQAVAEFLEQMHELQQKIEVKAA